MKVYVSFDFKSKLGEAALAQFTANVLSRMRLSSKFDSLKPFLDAELQPAYENFFRSLKEAADGSRTKIAEKRAFRTVLIGILEKLATNLVLLADGSEAVVLESGFNVRRRGQRSLSEVSQVQNVRAGQSDRPGEVILLFDPVPLARMYAVAWKTKDSTNWINGEYPSATRAVISNLPQRQELEFQVCALGSGQRKGAWSVPTRLFVQ